MRWRDGAGILAIAGIALAAALVVSGDPAGGAARPPRVDAAGWSGLVGEPRAQVATGQRVLVVLGAFSLADRVARAGGLASDADERRWAAAALAAQGQFISNLVRQGVAIRPEFRFTRTLNGFSATLDARAIAALERTPGVKGVYPVRVAYPAAVASSARPGSGAGIRLAGIQGRGLTIALLDTGVALHRAYLRGRVLDGIDVLGDGPDAQARAKPTDPAQVERHGTEIAGLIVGGVAPAASVLPIRVAGWQADQRGDYAVYARTDQLLEGLERAVDPNADGDAHDAARIALIPLVEPFAAFGDSPLARAIDGAQRLDTLVVTAAGNDGPGGPAFGSVGGPAGAPAALAVGALDARGATTDVRVVVRAGLSVLFDRRVPLAGAIPPDGTLLLRAAVPAAPVASQQAFFDHGASRVADRAAVVAATADPAALARWASIAGAAAVVLHGRDIAPGAIAMDERIGVPVVVLPDAIARALTRPNALIAIAAPRPAAAPARTLAPFSSWGLAFDGSVKPELLAPGVGLATAEPGTAPTGEPAFGAVSGSSAAAAVAAGAAALLAEARPDANAETLHALLVGGSDPLGRVPVAAQGAGLLDLGRAAAAEVVADPPALTFGRGSGDGWQGRRVLRLRNVSTRRLTVFVDTGQHHKPRVPLSVSARRVELEPGATARLEITARLLSIVRAEAATGALTFTPVGGAPMRVPWSVVLRPPAGLLGPLSLSRKKFKPSEQKPAIVLLRAGRVIPTPHATEVVPVLRLDVELWTVGGKRLGLLARLRDLLPGRYAFGLTGHGPTGRVLDPGRYELRVFGWPTGGGPPSTQATKFTIRS